MKEGPCPSIASSWSHHWLVLQLDLLQLLWSAAKIPDPLESISEHEHNCYLLVCKVDLVPASFNLIL